MFPIAPPFWTVGNRGCGLRELNPISTSTALENVVLPMLLAAKSMAEARKRAEELFDKAGIANWWDHEPRELSDGEQQRVAIAVALANDPPVILADAPTRKLESGYGKDTYDIETGLQKKPKTDNEPKQPLDGGARAGGW
jgi:predicted ABC-type transport system involved in lysophospholipase L1 biosynthesis ATPase subunit